MLKRQMAEAIVQNGKAMVLDDVLNTVKKESLSAYPL